MAPRKGGGGGSGGKKKGTKKRKSNVWDDYTAPAKGAGRGGSDDDGAQPQKKAKRESKESMFGQWKKHKQQFNNKKKSFFNTVGQKKQAQREQYLALKQRQADVIYEGSERQLTKKQRKMMNAQNRQTNAGDSEDEDDSDADSDESDDGDELMVTKKKKRGSVFDQFVQTFQPAEFEIDEEEKEDGDEDDEGEYEEVLVNEDGEEIDEDGNVIERNGGDEDGEATGDEADAEESADIDEDEDAEEEQEEEEDDTEQLELAQDQDPYRRRYLLTDFEERDAKKLDELPKKFTTLASQNEQGQVIHYASPSEYNVSYRNGSAAAEDSALTPVSSKLYVRSRLLDAWKAKQVDPETLWTPKSLEYSLFHQFCAYKDVFFAAQTYESIETLRRLSAMHVLNHIIKSRDTVARNNERLRKRQAKEKSNEASEAATTPAVTMQDEDEESKEYRDQGFCRATVLVLLPLRSSALAFVKLLLELLPANVDTFHNKDRFFSEYGSAKDDDDESEDESADGKDKESMKEWQKVFAEGNNDDCFQIGLSLSRKALRFYSAYQNADIILASPLGLRQQLGDEVVDLDTAAGSDVRLSTDFLTSIEVCVVDSASLMLMQNVEHLRHVVRAINVQPKEAPNADFARIREWNLAFLGVYFRQTIVFAHGVEPALNHLVTKCCKNQSGTVKYVRVCDPADGSASISRVVPQIKQIFQRVDLDFGPSLSAAAEVEIRFEYFKKHVFEPLLDHPKKHVLIFIPSYFDYVRVRNLFNDSMNKKLIRSVQCCEYTTNKQVSRARTSFFHGKSHVMLFTERFHFYHQYQIRGVHQLIWYGLPQMGAFYPEMLNMLGDLSASNGESGDVMTMESKSSIALFTRLDLFRMQRIVGHKRAERMCQPKAPKPTYFVTHFKSCHLKNLLYRFNGYSEEENSRVRFGPRRKKDANNWFGQLKSTEKRMISMQDNKWSEISERECWSCRLCNDGKADLTQVFELSELGRGQAFLHLRQMHERAYEEFLHKLPAVQNGALVNLRGTAGELMLGAMPASSSQPHPRARATQQHIAGLVSSEVRALAHPHPEPGTEAGRASDGGSGGGGGIAAGPGENKSVHHHTGAGNQEDNSACSLQQRMAEAERSRLRRLKASSAERQVEAMRSKKRRENLTPVQRQADYDRRKRKKKRQEESERSRKRREEASEESRRKELLRSRERRRNATEDQRKREAERSKRRRENASEEQRLKERERCRKRYETKKSRKGGSQYSSNNSSGNVSDDGSQSSMSASDYHYYHHREQHNNHRHHHQQQQHLYYQREQQHQQRVRYEGGHSHGTATNTQVQQQPARSMSSLPPAPPAAALSSGVTGHMRQVPPIDSIRVPPPPPPPPQSMDDVRSSLSDSSGFRLFSPSPSASTLASINGGSGRLTATPNSFLPSGLPIYSQHLSTSPTIRSAGAGGTGVGGGASLLGSTIGAGGGGDGGNSYQPTASSQSQFALPQLPHSLQALSQSLQPLPSAVTTNLNAAMGSIGSSSALTRVSNLTSGARSAVASARSSVLQSAQPTNGERSSSSGNNLAFV